MVLLLLHLSSLFLAQAQTRTMAVLTTTQTFSGNNTFTSGLTATAASEIDADKSITVEITADQGGIGTTFVGITNSTITISDTTTDARIMCCWIWNFYIGTSADTGDFQLMSRSSPIGGSNGLQRVSTVAADRATAASGCALTGTMGGGSASFSMMARSGTNTMTLQCGTFECNFTCFEVH